MPELLVVNRMLVLSVCGGFEWSLTWYHLGGSAMMYDQLS
jgi:hypothetical protein